VVLLAMIDSDGSGWTMVAVMATTTACVVMGGRTREVFDSLC